MYYHHNMQNQTQVSIVKVMDRGLLVIPKKIREKAEVFKGSYIKIIYKNGQIILEPLVDQFTNKPLKKPKRDLILRNLKIIAIQLKLIISLKLIKF